MLRSLIAEQKLDAALTEAKRVLKADERNVPAMQALGDVWYREKKYELARDVLETAANVDPTNAETANAQGFVLLAMDQKPLAIEAFRHAVALAPELAEARNNLGVLLSEAVNDFDGAAAQLGEAVKLVPDSRRALAQLWKCAAWSQALRGGGRRPTKARIELWPGRTRVHCSTSRSSISTQRRLQAEDRGRSPDPVGAVLRRFSEPRWIGSEARALSGGGGQAAQAREGQGRAR